MAPQTVQWPHVWPSSSFTSRSSRHIEQYPVVVMDPRRLRFSPVRSLLAWVSAGLVEFTGGALSIGGGSDCGRDEGGTTSHDRLFHEGLNPRLRSWRLMSSGCTWNFHLARLMRHAPSNRLFRTKSTASVRRRSNGASSLPGGIELDRLGWVCARSGSQKLAAAVCVVCLLSRERSF